MILGINGIRLTTPRSGVARAIEAILRCIGELPHPFDEVRVYSPSALPGEVHLPAIAHNVVVPSNFGGAMWEQIALPRAHSNRGLLLCPSYVAPFFSASPTFVIHHGSYEGYRAGFGRMQILKARLAYAASARRAAGVSTVSEYSRCDMAKFYYMSKARINVVPEGVDTRVFTPDMRSSDVDATRHRVIGSARPYILYVGKPAERRNLVPLLRAFARLRRERALPHALLLVGGDLPGTSSFRAVIRELALESDVVVLGYATHAEMPLIYKGASLLVYPSSYEGFGMPVLEAMACGTPVVALNNTAFPEFAGGVAHLLPDARVETLEKGIADVLNDEPWQARMGIDGPRRAAGYDWHKITQQYLNLMTPIARQFESRARRH